ncbi:translocator protein, LysE family [Bacteriovorax sp. BAL6_X]|uniref:LysE/ArgO family amino acid transporter n=1 Tax=Bacteriovorax sp. BAL6_X TaxID=1201290 RepID=UPI00038555D3|nr:LysE family transporter [Bacteriovorax sp. BAL6_X]EPZ49290.1 translocator protein, LysE family [Bacteriovorax sp. BAL6_X]
MFAIFSQGFLLQASLILALGAQNLFVIDVGLKKNNHILAATICSICDVALILLGVLGVSALLVKTPIFKVGVGGVGALFLLYYSYLKLKESFFGIEMKKDGKTERLSKKLIILTTLSFTLLNPHVYIDTFFLVGGYSTKFESIKDKLTFGFGAGLFSMLWFYFLAYFSSRFSTFLTKEKNLKKVSFFTGLILAYLAYMLGFDAYRELINNL